IQTPTSEISAKLVNYARIASNEEDIQRIAAIIRVGVLAKSGLNIRKLTALKYGTFTEKVLTFLEPYLEDSPVKFFPEEKRPTSPERIYKKSFNKANKKTIAPDPVLTKVDDLIKQLSSLSINIANIQDKLYSLTNRERNRYALGFYSRPIITARVQGQDMEASSDAEDRDIAINIISRIPILIDRKAPRKRLSSQQLTFVVDLTLNFGRIRVNYEAFTDKDLPWMQVRISSLKSPIMLALLDTSAKTNILTASTARDLNLECRPI
ncbi:hypothetical protein L249_6017, partial [Ophiocordyceps polyrhachis-furcata BCC 54312]